MPTKKPQRNGHACHAIMRKGGVHQPSQKRERQEAKKALSRGLSDWRSKVSFLFTPVLLQTL